MTTQSEIMTHLYISTACQHGVHGQCSRSCKICVSPCLCPCHGLAGGVDHKLDTILTRLDAMKRQEHIEMATIQEVKAKQAELRASIESETDIVTSVKTLLEGQNAQLAALKQQLADAIAGGGNSAALQEVLDGMTAMLATNEADKQATVDAVVANTPAA